MGLQELKVVDIGENMKPQVPAFWISECATRDIWLPELVFTGLPVCKPLPCVNMNLKGM